jgi:hypothetical protein
VRAARTGSPRNSGGGPAWPVGPAAAGASEFLLDIVTEQHDEPVAVVWFTAFTTAAAIGQARRFVAAYDGPAGRFGELYARHGDVAEYQTEIEIEEN